MLVRQHGLSIAIAGQTELVVVFLDGALDVWSRPLLVRTLEGLTAQRFERLWVDLAGLTCIDDGAIDALLQAHERTCAQGREFDIRSPSREVARMLEQRADCAMLLAGDAS